MCRISASIVNRILFIIITIIIINIIIIIIPFRLPSLVYT